MTPHQIGYAQAHEKDFSLHTLGWKAFQDLCGTVTSVVLGQTVQQFMPMNDAGRDGAFQGTWKDATTGEMNGSFVIQCKHSSNPTASLTLGSVANEIEKAKSLAKRGLADNYLLITNRQVSARNEGEIRHTFEKIRGINKCLVFGNEWLCSKIRESSRLRMLVPRVYGLGDLTQIIDTRAYEQASEILISLSDDLTKFVVTKPYIQSANAISEHGFVILLGEPASGKSMIASTLAVGSIDRFGCMAIKIRHGDEFVSHWNPREPKQFFWVDDAFGQTQYLPELVYKWNAALPHVRAAVRNGAKIVFTSRDYIFNAAQEDLKASEFPLLKDSQVLINVQDLTKLERAQILYNHIKLGTQSLNFRKQIKRFLPEVVDHPDFVPEICRRLGDPTFTQGRLLTRLGVRKFVQDRAQILVGVLGNLDDESKSALALIFMNGGTLPARKELTRDERKARKLLGGTESGIRKALNALNGCLVKLIVTGTIQTWTFKHPTIADAFATLISSDPELFSIYLSGTRIGRLVNEIACGVPALENVRVVIPEDQYLRVMARLGELEDRETLFIFLSSRCGRVFLAKYLDTHPLLLTDLMQKPEFPFYSAPVRLLHRFHQLELLPEAVRQAFVSYVRRRAIVEPDADFLILTQSRELLVEPEIQSILDRVHRTLLPRVPELIEEELDASYYPDVNPEDRFYNLDSALMKYANEFKGKNDNAYAQCMGLRTQVRDAIDRLMEDFHVPDEDNESYHEDEELVEQDFMERNIFDDIDS